MDMYLEISYEGDLLEEIQLSAIGNATNLQKYLEGLYEKYNDEYDLDSDYDEPGEWVTDLNIAAIYND